MVNSSAEAGDVPHSVLDLPHESLFQLPATWHLLHLSPFLDRPGSLSPSWILLTFLDLGLTSDKALLGSSNGVVLAAKLQLALCFHGSGG